MLGRVLTFTAVLCALRAGAQEPASERARELALHRAWSEACARILEGQPWGDVAEDLEVALTKAGETKTSDTIEDYLESIRLAESQASSVPDDLSEASPSELVTALMGSRVVGSNPAYRDLGLVLRPLRLIRFVDGSFQVYWDDHADVPVHKMTDPAIRVFQRGREMVPALLEALDDQTATRAGFISTSGHVLPILFRRSDLAMALLEAITRCRFYVSALQDSFSRLDASTREAAVELARNWWRQTQSLPELEARCWLLDRIDYAQAEPMIEVLARVEDHTDIAIRHLRRYLVGGQGPFNAKVARRLCELGDASALDAVVSRGRGGSRLMREELKLLVDFGGRREFSLLQRLVAKDKPLNERTRNRVSRDILAAMEKTQNRLAVPVFAEALDVEDEVVETVSTGNRRGVPLASRAEFAAFHIQRLTGRDFRFDERASATSRRKAIERVRSWWEAEGKGLYGFQARRVRRTGGIR